MSHPDLKKCKELSLMILNFLFILINLFNYIDRGFISSLDTTFVEQYNITDTTSGFINSSFIIGYLVFSPLFSILVKKYNTLPDEVQRTICKYVRKDIYYRRYCEKISTIIINKAINFMKNYYLTYPQFEFIQSIRDGERRAFETLENINYLKNMFKEIIHIFYLIDKYISILDISQIKNYHFDDYENNVRYNLKYKLIEMGNLCLLCKGFISSMVSEFRNYNFNCVHDLSRNLGEKY